jgi:hypothetical protein
MFTKEEYEALHALVFRPDYSGYRPSVLEIPNGDGKADTEKRYAHVAPKYFTTDEQRETLTPYLEKAFNLARAAADLAKFPADFMPDIRYGALRVLDYPPGAVSNLHEDFDLFTLMMYRDQPDRFVAHDDKPTLGGSSPTRWPPGSLDPVHVEPSRIVALHPDGSVSRTKPVGEAIGKIRLLNKQAHLGQLCEAIGLGKATPHEVLPSETRQCSIVYFAIPDHDAVLPLDPDPKRTVREWLNERMARSRTEFKKYE